MRPTLLHVAAGIGSILISSLLATAADGDGPRIVRQAGNTVALAHVTLLPVPDPEMLVVGALGDCFLESADESTLHLEVNLEGPNDFRSVGEVTIKRGQSITPMSVPITQAKRDTSRPLLARLRLSLPDGTSIVSSPRIVPTPDLAENQRDYISIIGTVPEKLIAGQEQEITIYVTYNLQSTDAGEIAVGFNRSSPNGYGIDQTRTIARGAGELQITTKVKPQSWGEFTFFKVFAHLAESPHGPRWSPLAGDELALTIQPATH